MRKVVNICFWGKPYVTFRYNPIGKLSLDSVELMQYTGLHDKNGKEIWEGDIVEFETFFSADKQLDIVTLDKFPRLWLEHEEFGWEGEKLINPERTIVVGNIFENPDMLKGYGE